MHVKGFKSGSAEGGTQREGSKTLTISGKHAKGSENLIADGGTHTTGPTSLNADGVGHC